MSMEKLYRAYYMDVYSFAMTMVKDSNLAEEITQETFYRAMRSRFLGKSSELTWLCAIAKNLCVDALRAKNKTGEIANDTQAPTNVEQMVMDKASTLAIHQALHVMEEPYKEVFSLRIFGELSFAEIGTIFGKTENWARVTYHRAKLRLQGQLKI